MMLNFDRGKVSLAPIVLHTKVDMIRHKSSPCLLLVLQKCSDLKDLLLWNPKNQIKILLMPMSAPSQRFPARNRFENSFFLNKKSKLIDLCRKKKADVEIFQVTFPAPDHDLLCI